MATHSIFRDKHKFKDDVWGQILLNDLERDVIDTPEFQRLFRTSQMGFVDLVYQTANHTRGTHAIGACHISKMLMDHLNENTQHQSGLDIKISRAEQVLIRVGALLHDITHIPLSHDLEKKTHKVFYSGNGDGKPDSLETRSYYGFYDKHDDYDRNPHLYLLLCDENKSVLARLLNRSSKEFYNLLREDSQLPDHSHLREFVDLLSGAKVSGWDPDVRLLPDLLFHLLTYEKPDEASKPVREVATAFDKNDAAVVSTWGLGPEPLRNQIHNSWYQPFRHDIIGNTLSADLLDYLQRDAQRLGLDRHADQYLLNYYVLVRYESENDGSKPAADLGRPLRYRCAIDLHDQKRGTPRVGLVNEIFRLLDLRHEIHEKAVLHRVVLAANAMLSRALLLLKQKPTLKQMIKVGDRTHSLHGDESFFQQLLQNCDNNSQDKNPPQSVTDARRIIQKLIDRCVYRPLLIIPGDRAAGHFWQASGSKDDSVNNEYNLRSLATILDSRYYSAFLLFVCACIEKFLQGAFSSDEALCAFAQTCVQNSKDVGYIEEAMHVIPSRVVLWTTPYKQLYKDPEVVVALDGRVERIDYLKNYTSGHHAPVIDRVRTAIQDADSKYATLWKLYVFISDGLFYTGTVNRLKEYLAGGTISSSEIQVNQHRSRLKRAQRLIIAALETVWKNWTDVREVEPVKNQKNLLEKRMDVVDFKKLVGIWAAFSAGTYQKGADPVSKLSTVDVNHYIHGDPLAESAGSNCRDIRSKTDISAVKKWGEARASKSGPGHELIGFLQGLGIDDPNVLSEVEFEQLCEIYDPLYHKDTDSLLHLLGHDPSSPGSNLVKLCLSGFPWPVDKRTQEPKEPGIVIDDTLIPRPAPQTRQEIERWLLDEAVILQPHVRKQLTTDLAPIIEFIESAPIQLRPGILTDLRSRFRNDSMLFDSEIKSHQIVESLKRRWG